MDTIIQWDVAMFEAINGSWQNGLLDAIMPLWRNKYIWIPLYTFLISFLLINFRRNGFYVILFAILTITIGDTISSRLIKKNVKRLRPCKQELLQDRVHLLVSCGSGYSFPSSHAVNHFALAAFLIGALGRRFKKIRLLLLLWAGSIAFGQVYVGVHFPIDVVAGSLLGLLIGTMVALLYRKVLAQTSQIR